MISACECVNRLYHDVYWEVRDVVSGERKSEKMRAGVSDWACTKPEIEARFGVTDSYSKSLANMDRAVSLANFMGVTRWLVSLVREEDRQEVRDLVMHMLKI